MNQNLKSILKTKNKESPLTEDTNSNRKPKRSVDISKRIPYLLVGGFLFVFLFLFWEELLPAKKVETARVLTTAHTRESNDKITTKTDYNGKVLFQASGWIEADPYPYDAPTLINGIVKTVEVLEGETVEKGQLLATLDSDDAKLDLETAKLDVRRLQLDLESHHQMVEGLRAELENAKHEVNVQSAKLAELSDVAQRMLKLSDGAVPEQDVKQALLREATQKAILEAAKSKETQQSAVLAQHQLMHKSLEVSVAKAKVAKEKAKLQLDRTQIKAPISGIIQTLYVEPGHKRMANSDQLESLTIARIFDPEKLQARIDVPLEEASKMQIGQPVLLRSSMLASRIFKGEVTRIVGESDLQRNTLQAKIRIIDPDPRLRPEMLCRVEFLDTHASGSATSDLAIFAPEAALKNRSGESAIVFRLDESRKRVEEVSITVNPSPQNGFYEVTESLRPNDVVILNPSSALSNGDRVKIKK